MSCQAFDFGVGTRASVINYPAKVNFFRIEYVRTAGSFRSDIFQSEVLSSSTDHYILGDRIPYSVHLADGKSLGAFKNTNTKWPGWRETTIRCYGYLSMLWCDLTNYGVRFQSDNYGGSGIGANVVYAGYADYCEWFESYLQHGCLWRDESAKVSFSTYLFYADARFYNHLPQTCPDYMCSDCGWTPSGAYYLKADLPGIGSKYEKNGPGVEERLAALIKLKHHTEL